MRAHLRTGTGLLGFAVLALCFGACSASSTGDDYAGPSSGTGGSAGASGGSGGSAVDSGTKDVVADTRTDALDASTDTSGSDGCGSIAETCDGKDNNCNGQVDEGNPGGGSTCESGKQGICSAGTTQCVNGAIKCVQTNLPDNEICDGKDNNCDGTVDENDPGGGVSCDTGLLGACKEGVSHCLSGVMACQPVTSPTSETCNGIDDNCDGTIDNGTVAGAGEPCTVPGQPAGTPCAESKAVCSGGGLSCPQTFFPDDETCNDIDDDCNGEVDDPSAVNGKSCSTGLAGICSTGSSLCQSGNPSCTVTVTPGSVAEICNGQDDNCNGSTDEMSAQSVCPSQHPQASQVATWGCTTGSCRIQGCNSSYYDVDSSVGNGCECQATTYPTSCSAASAISVPRITSVSSPITRTGHLPVGGSAWFVVTFAKPSMGTAYHFRAALTDSHSDEFGMNVRTTCSNYASCTDGTNKGQDADVWEAVTSYVSGAGCCSDSPAPPTQIYVEIYRKTSSATCNTFSLAFANY